jgi:hypothetical protein
MAWMSGVAGPTMASIDLSVIEVATLATGVLVILALGREFAIRPDEAFENATADLPIDPEDADTSGLVRPVTTSGGGARVSRALAALTVAAGGHRLNPDEFTRISRTPP